MNKHLQKVSEIILDNLSNEVQKFSGRSVLLTGAGGFLGSNLCSFFYHLNNLDILDKPLKLFAYDKFIHKKEDWVNEYNKSTLINFYEEDILSIKNFPKCDYIIHAASIASPIFYRKYPLETIDSNVVGLRRLLDLSLDFNPEGILFFSTSEIYGNPDSDNIPTKETYFGNVNSFGPRASYDESKRLSETLCYIYNDKFELPINIVRPFNNYGPGLNINDGRVIPDFFKNILENKDIEIYSDGTSTRTFCYISDAITGYLLALLSKDKGEIYNIGSAVPEISMSDLANLIIEISNSKSKIVYKTNKDIHYLTNNPQRRCPDISKAKNKLNFSPNISLEEGLEYTYNYYSDRINEN
tara:strand:- start:389 stop:1453 length:1065 start_codon:yes stop_codon:yes gene_type:complete